LVIKTLTPLVIKAFAPGLLVWLWARGGIGCGRITGRLRGVLIVACVKARIGRLLRTIIRAALNAGCFGEARRMSIGHALVMIGILEIVFGENNIAVHLRVFRHILIFFNHFYSVGANAAVVFKVIAAKIITGLVKTLAAAAVTIIAACTIAVAVTTMAAHPMPFHVHENECL
jgi:uncharacterized membrane protein